MENLLIIQLIAEKIILLIVEKKPVEAETEKTLPMMELLMKEPLTMKPQVTTLTTVVLTAEALITIPIVEVKILEMTQADQTIQEVPQIKTQVLTQPTMLQKIKFLKMKTLVIMPQMKLSQSHQYVDYPAFAMT